jgi:biotin operon repressor
MPKARLSTAPYHFHVPLAQQITDTRAHLALPSLMEASTLLMFQPLGGGQAAINGDFAMTADQVNPVIQALQTHGITIISLHNHLLYESPRLFYMHFWAAGDATTLAQGLRAALNATTH